MSQSHRTYSCELRGGRYSEPQYFALGEGEYATLVALSVTGGDLNLAVYDEWGEHLEDLSVDEGVAEALFATQNRIPVISTTPELPEEVQLTGLVGKATGADCLAVALYPPTDLRIGVSGGNVVFTCGGMALALSVSQILGLLGTAQADLAYK
jgi:hypothetical protein